MHFRGHVAYIVSHELLWWKKMSACEPWQSQMLEGLRKPGVLDADPNREGFRRMCDLQCLPCRFSKRECPSKAQIETEARPPAIIRRELTTDCCCY